MCNELMVNCCQNRIVYFNFFRFLNRSKLLIVNSLVILFFNFKDPSVLTAQNVPTGDCQAIFNKAVAYDRAGDYEKAILKYNAVKACDPNFKGKADSIILTVFKKMNALREQAERDKQKAILAQKKEEQAKKRFEEQVETTQKALRDAEFQKKKAEDALAEAQIQRKKADSLRVIAQSRQRKADNQSKYYKRKTEQLDHGLLFRMVEYMYLKHPDDDAAERIYNENLTDKTLEDVSKSQVLDFEQAAITTCIAISPDRQLMFTGNNYGTGILRDVEGNSLQTFVGHYNPIISACFSADNNTILTVCFDGIANLWNLKGELIRTLFVDDDYISYAAFSKDAQKIVTAANDITALLRDTTGKVLSTFKGHKAEITALAFSDNGQYVLTGSLDSTARLYTVTGELVHVFKSHQGSILAVAISPNGDYIAASNETNEVLLWDKKGQDIEHLKHNSKVTTMRFSQDNATLLMGSEDGSIYSWQRSDSVELVLKAHTKPISALAFVPYSTYAVSAAYDSNLRLWDLNADELLIDTIQLKDKSNIEIYFPPNDSTFAVLSRNKGLQVYTFYNQLLQTYKDAAGIIKATFAPDNKTILIATSDQKMKLLDLDGRVLQIFQEDSIRGDTVIALAFSADGQFILSQNKPKSKSMRYDNYEFQIKLWDKKGRLLRRFDNVYGYLVGFSPHKQSLLVRDFNSNTLLEYPLDSSPANNARYNMYVDAYNPHFPMRQKKMVIGSGDNKVHLFDEKDILKRSYPAHDSSISALSLSIDDQFIAVGTKKGTVMIWDTAGHLIKVLPQQDSNILALAFSPDNQKIWLCTEGGDIAIYKVNPIQICSYFQLHQLGIGLEPDDQVAIAQSLLAEEARRKEKIIGNEDNRLKMERIYKEREKRRSAVYEEKEKKRREEEEKRDIEVKKRLDEVIKTKKATLIETREFLEIVINLMMPEPDSAYTQHAHSEDILFDLYLTKKDSLDYKTIIANKYNSLAWEQLLRKEYVAAEKSLRRGIVLDSNTIILYTNLAPCLLFQGKFEEAKAEYLRWKDKPFNIQDFTTFKDAFWADFRSFEEANCIPPERLADVAAIKALLK